MAPSTGMEGKVMINITERGKRKRDEDDEDGPGHRCSDDEEAVRTGRKD